MGIHAQTRGGSLGCRGETEHVMTLWSPGNGCNAVFLIAFILFIKVAVCRYQVMPAALTPEP